MFIICLLWFLQRRWSKCQLTPAIQSKIVSASILTARSSTTSSTVERWFNTLALLGWHGPLVTTWLFPSFWGFSRWSVEGGISLFGRRSHLQFPNVFPCTRSLLKLWPTIPAKVAFVDSLDDLWGVLRTWSLVRQNGVPDARFPSTNSCCRCMHSTASEFKSTLSLTNLLTSL